MQLDRPSKIVCVGLNYVDHASEVAMTLPARPLTFAKWPDAIIRNGADIVIPDGVCRVDYEAELAVVIGRTTRNANAETALDAVAAYTCLNEVSARGEQLCDGQRTRGKSFDTFCPIGPRLVAATEPRDPQSLRISCRLNGVTVRDSTTADMIFGIAELIAYISRGITLERGHIVATGTQPGVALGRANPRFLQHGEEVEIEIEGIGVLRNPMRAA